MKTSANIHRVTPWKKLTGRKAKVNSIQQYGESCFMQMPKETRNKNGIEIEKAKLAKLLGQNNMVVGWIVKIDYTGRITYLKDICILTGRQLVPKGAMAHNMEANQMLTQDNAAPEHVQLGWPKLRMNL